MMKNLKQVVYEKEQETQAKLLHASTSLGNEFSPRISNSSHGDLQFQQRKILNCRHGR